MSSDRVFFKPVEISTLIQRDPPAETTPEATPFMLHTPIPGGPTPIDHLWIVSLINVILFLARETPLVKKAQLNICQ